MLQLGTIGCLMVRPALATHPATPPQPPSAFPRPPFDPHSRPRPTATPPPHRRHPATMSAASQAVRTAGRGATLRPATENPLTRLPSKRPAPRRGGPPPAGRGRALAKDPSARSALSASVLTKRAPSPRRRERARPRDAPSNFGFEKDLPMGGGHRQPRKSIRDWFDSEERKDALEAFQMMETEPVGSGTVERPFAWRDYQKIVGNLPEEHWATPFVAACARSVEANPNMEGATKDSVVQELLEKLSSLSAKEVGEERFQDA